MEDFYDYIVGDKYNQPTFEYYEWSCENDNDELFNGKMYYDTTIKYITNTGGLILEVNENVVDETFDTSMYSGKMIKEYYPDFTGDDDKEYCVHYEPDSPFYN